MALDTSDLHYSTAPLTRYLADVTRYVAYTLARASTVSVPLVFLAFSDRLLLFYVRNSLG